MLYGLAADALVVIHLAFILLVVLGGFLLLKWPKLIFVHIPVLAWGITVEFTGWICPLTPWEQNLRQAAGQHGYSGSFIEHYLVPAIYPEHLTRELQIGLGIFVILINLLAYGLFLKQRRNTS